MRKTIIIIAVVLAAIVAYVVWLMYTTRFIGTPVVAIRDLKYDGNAHCGKSAIVKGKVSQHIGNDGYEIEQDGVTLPVMVGKRTNQVLPTIGKNIEAHVMMVCSNGAAMFMGASFSEQP